jgi:hypothetical protein
MAKSKVKRFAGGGGSGRSSYQGNENSYTQASDPDAVDSVGKGALTRQLIAAAAARDAEAPVAARAARDFDAVEMAAPAAEETTPNDLAESRMIRGDIAKSELESGRAKVREQDAAAAMRKAPVVSRAKAVLPDAAALMQKYKPRYTPPGLAPRTTMGRQPQPYMPAPIDNSYPGSRLKGGGKVRSASSRADGIAIRGKTRA